MKTKIKTLWISLTSTLHYKIIRELLFWAIIILSYNIPAMLMTEMDDVTTYIGLFIGIVVTAFPIARIYKYGIYLIKKFDL